MATIRLKVKYSEENTTEMTFDRNIMAEKLIKKIVERNFLTQGLGMENEIGELKNMFFYKKIKIILTFFFFSITEKCRLFNLYSSQGK